MCVLAGAVSGAFHRVNAGEAVQASRSCSHAPPGALTKNMTLPGSCQQAGPAAIRTHSLGPTWSTDGFRRAPLSRRFSHQMSSTTMKGFTTTIEKKTVNSQTSLVTACSWGLLLPVGPPLLPKSGLLQGSGHGGNQICQAGRPASPQRPLIKKYFSWEWECITMGRFRDGL